MNEHAPKYIAVYHQIKTDILSGKYPVGGFLPPEGDLMKQFNKSRTTIRKAISILKGENLLNVQQGRGSEVLALHDWPMAYRTDEVQLRYSNLSISAKFLVPGEYQTATQNAVVDVVLAEIKVAKALGIETGSEVFRLHRVHLVNDSIFAYVVSHIPCELAPGLKEYSGKIDEGYDQFFEEKLGLQITSIEDTLTAIQAGFLESRLLNVPVGAPLLLRKRISFDHERKIEYSERINRPDLYELVMTLEKSRSESPRPHSDKEIELP